MLMPRDRHWNLGAKLALVATPFLLLGLALIALTLWMSWQLDGGAAAVNEAGRLRMQTWRMALVLQQAEPAQLENHVAEMERSLALLRSGDPERPLMVPWDDTARERFDQVQQSWSAYRQSLGASSLDAAGLTRSTTALSRQIDAFVAAIETHMSVWTAMLHLAQTSMLALAVLGAAVLLLAGYRFVLEPVAELKQAIRRMQQGDLRARVSRITRDEFGTLAEGFNQMADHLESMYHGLEAKVAAKTAELEDKKARLESLYQVTSLVARATTLEDLSNGFVGAIREVAHADAVALRWSDQSNQRYVMLATLGLPEELSRAEQCLHAGDCHCGAPGDGNLRVIPIHAAAAAPLEHCARAGFGTVISIPVRQHGRLMGEVDLFFHAVVQPGAAERSLLEALTHHLAGAMDNLRLGEREKEAAVSQERGLLAQELHDSIAQSLAFLRIQVQLMRDAMASADPEAMGRVLGEIDTGVRESYADVRELLLNFRVRGNDEDIEPALAATLRKFEHQSGVRASMTMEGHGLPLPADVQIQVLHIVQEALSNVRKHAHASRVRVDVQQQPCWRFEVRDDGIGFEGDGSLAGEDHVGLRIMSERAARIGATLEVSAMPGGGTRVLLSLATLQPATPAMVPKHAAGAALHH